MDVEKVHKALEEHNSKAAFEKLLVKATWLLAMSFAVSAVLNFFLAIYILKSPAGTPEFVAELGRMTALSYPVIVVPSMVVMGFALWVLLSGVKKLTGLGLEEIFHAQAKK